MAAFELNLSRALMLTGIALVLCGIVATLAWRKPGVTVGALVRGGTDAHREHLLRPDRAPVVRALVLAGVSLSLAGALLLLALGL